MQVLTPGTSYTYGAPELVLHSRSTIYRLTLTEHQSQSYTHGAQELVLHSRSTRSRLFTLTGHQNSSYHHVAPELVLHSRSTRARLTLMEPQSSSLFFACISWVGDVQFVELHVFMFLVPSKKDVRFFFTPICRMFMFY